MLFLKSRQHLHYAITPIAVSLQSECNAPIINAKMLEDVRLSDGTLGQPGYCAIFQTIRLSRDITSSIKQTQRRES